jgi:hypothetical protein
VLAIAQAEIEQKISSRRRKRREFERLCGSVFSILGLMLLAFTSGVLFSQRFL